MSCDKAILEQDDELFDIAGEVVRLAEAAGLTLGCAESCTGGLVSGCLTAIQGSSAVVRGGVVSYAIPVKHDVLGVPYDGVLSVPEIGDNAINPAIVVMELPITDENVCEIACAIARCLSPS